MKRTLYILVLVLINTWLFGQESNLIYFLPSECDNNVDVSRIRDRISDIHFQCDTLVVRVGFVANCGYSNSNLMANAFYLNDTLYLSYDLKPTLTETIVEDGTITYHSFFEFQDCNCCFEFLYLVKNIPANILIPVKLNDKLIKFCSEKYKTYPVQFEIFDGDTINYVSKYGLNQGVWIKFNEKGQILMNRFYIDGKISKGTDYRYYKNGNIRAKLFWINNEYSDYYEYDEEGNLKAHKKNPIDDY
ncbi:MAG: hypothetical protein P1P88_23045 [Bacteroidales bacterium]|nr:hypothetical protein [Bacteroidales bacterium]